MLAGCQEFEIELYVLAMSIRLGPSLNRRKNPTFDAKPLAAGKTLGEVARRKCYPTASRFRGTGTNTGIERSHLLHDNLPTHTYSSYSIRHKSTSSP